MASFTTGGVDDSTILMHEIYASLVVATTLGSEIRMLEESQTSSPLLTQSVAAEALEAVTAATADAEAMEQAAADALQAAMHERTLRMRQASKLRVLQTESAGVPAVLAELEAERKRGELRERALRDAQLKAQQATERHAAASYGLRAERQQALRHFRAAGARRLASVARHDVCRALSHCFTSWAAKVAVGIHTPAQYHPEQQQAMARMRIAAGGSLSPSSASSAVANAEGYSELHRTLNLRNAECLRLREYACSLEAALSVQHTQEVALRRSADRAAEASLALLEARRAQAELRAENSELRARLAGYMLSQPS